jgi:phytoene dehydrogenase-like protein
MGKIPRRDFIKTVIGGAVMTCLFPEHLIKADTTSTSRLTSESNTLCHGLRDGEVFRFPPPSKHYEVIIVGGGPSGLVAGYMLRDKNILLLEKEPRVGGNAISEKWEGVWYSTGVAWTSSPLLEDLFQEIGLTIYRINSLDAAIINGKRVPEFWGEGIYQAPYPESVRKSFIQFKKDILGLDLKANKEKLDQMTFAELLKPYAPEVRLWFDNYGANNWGGNTESTSAYIGAESVHWGTGVDSKRFTLPGGLGRASEGLRQKIEAAGAHRVITEATTLRVANQSGGKAEVSYFYKGEVITVTADAAIMAAPKFITKHLVKDLPDDEARAMRQMRYAPYLVVNVCTSEVVYNRSYDTNIPAPSLIADFNVADWVIHRDGGNRKRKHVLTCYIPLPEAKRALIQSDNVVRKIGQRVVDQLDEWFPGARKKTLEIRIYRRGHAMHISAPGVLTKLAPLLARPYGRILFANTDSLGGVSDFDSAARAARNAVQATEVLIAKESDY